MLIKLTSDVKNTTPAFVPDSKLIRPVVSLVKTRSVDDYPAARSLPHIKTFLGQSNSFSDLSEYVKIKAALERCGDVNAALKLEPAIVTRWNIHPPR